MALNTNERNAIHRAIELKGAALVQRVEYGLYLVPSSKGDGVVYTVTARGADYQCTCQAGERGLRCWHQAAVFLAKLEARGQARVKAPSPCPRPVVLAGETLRRRTGRVQVAL